MPVSKPHAVCRVCKGTRLSKYLDLGLMPLSNNLAGSTIASVACPKYPLEVLFCEDCYLSQLSVVIDPQVMFGHYVYRSSINQGYVKHCRQMAIDLRNRFALTANSFHVDIAGNDGALLNEFKKVIGLQVLNVDPAENLTGICEAAGIGCLTKFWGKQTAQSIVNSSGLGKADLITATNVFAHVDNVHEFIEAAKILLKPNGRLVMEFPYLIDFIENNEFDTIYFEHLSYFSIAPLQRLCVSQGMMIESVERLPIHGGSVRVVIGLDGKEYRHYDAKKYIYPSVENEIENELLLGYQTIDKYLAWSHQVKKTISDFREKIITLRGTGARIAAFAASAKGNTLLNCARITVGSISYIVDETPEKIGKYSPGNGIPIVSMLDLQNNPPDYLVILSWNFKEEIIEKVRKIYSGKFIIPIPKFQIID